MELSPFFKAVIDAETAPVVICDLNHTIIYMNPTAIERYKKRGGSALVGKSLLDCHNSESNEKIKKVTDWFGKSKENNIVYTFHNPKENKDVYMVALRDDNGKLIGYYEKHEKRTLEENKTYNID